MRCTEVTRGLVARLSPTGIFLKSGTSLGTTTLNKSNGRCREVEDIRSYLLQAAEHHAQYTAQNHWQILHWTRCVRFPGDMEGFLMSGYRHWKIEVVCLQQERVE